MLNRIWSLAILAGLASAQQVLVVDAAGGAGSQFRTIPPAIAAAAPGDTVLVRAGLYSEALVIDKGIRLVGEDAQLIGILTPDGSVLVRNLPAGETFAMRGFRAAQVGFTGPMIHVRDCRGSVSLRDLRQGGLMQFAVTIRNSAQVHVAEVTLRLAQSTASTAVFEQVVCDAAAFAGLWITGGQVDCMRCTLRGSLSAFGGPAVQLDSGRVRLTQSTATGTPAGLTPSPAINSLGGEIHLDPTTVVQASNGALPIAGPATVIRRELTSLSARTDGTTLTADLQGAMGAFFAIIASAPSPTLATPFGDQWLDPTVQVIVDVGRLAQGRQHRWSLPHPPITPGLTITMQAVTLSRDYEFSMATLIAFP